jgi:2-iminoacetate synthase ThiH
MQTIPYLLICAVNACQNSCKHCAHKGMMDSDRDYQMPLEDIAALLNRLKAIDCKIKTVSKKRKGGA